MNPENLKSGDNDELEALFNEIAEQKVWEQQSEADASSVDSANAEASHDKKEISPSEFAETEVAKDPLVALEALEAIAHERADSDVLAKRATEDPLDVFQRVGMLTRKLHDALRELGYDQNVETAVNSLPDARARLAYIADLTGQAAEKVLAAVEASQNLNDQIAAKASKLDEQWDRLFNHEMTLDEFKEHIQENRRFIRDLTGEAGSMSAHLTDIMMAQDFHDLTGQVVKKIATMAQNLEEQLVQLLLDTTPANQRHQVEDTWLNGPVIDPTGRTDVCSTQGQVDDLLESLGF